MGSEPWSEKVKTLLANMQLHEKIGQLCQVSGNEGHVSDDLANQIRQGWVGSVINEVDPKTLQHLQHIAINESRLGIPLLIGRDVIHGFKTIFPIPLGQAASWSADLVEQAAAIAAQEASSIGINWTFAPMIDISRDPRWGRIAESLGEDPYLCSVLGAAMVRGFQGEQMSSGKNLAACAKHFAGYGASESGRDYATTNIPENELRNIYLPPFKVAAEAGVATFMSSFSDLDGVPASGNKWLMTEVLRDEWQFQGFVVSDWESIFQLQIHGLTANAKESALLAFDAGIDMEMVSNTYRNHLIELLDAKHIDIEQINVSVAKILTLKEQLGLFDNPELCSDLIPAFYHPDHLAVAKELATKSCVLLQNQNHCLPIDKHNIKNVALIGPLANDGYEQLGTWIFDGEPQHSITLLDAMREECGDAVTINYQAGMSHSRSHSTELFDPAIEAAQQSDVIVLCLGEEAILSGEAHCRADIDLPGNQTQLIDILSKLGKPIVMVLMAGRPLTIETVLPKVDSILYAWHPGTMAGPAISDLLFGNTSPSGKTPVTFPRKVGQIPIYYNQKHSGKPPTEAQCIYIDDIPQRSPQTSLGMAATHLDTHFSPLFEFGFGLSYSEFRYSELQLNQRQILPTDSLTLSFLLKNHGQYDAEEVVQVYIRDLVGSVTRPVKELKRFRRIKLAAGEQQQVTFTLTADDLAFYNRQMKLQSEAGHFHIWVGGSSACTLKQEFELLHD
ncbi:beta-glucosidase BglX [Aliiglaciecola litoralis]|uniref:beta-glucosidase n=2 Tax=Aliiglaciecola litoralis TaxID=582857 RepID=A0ABN1LPA2_9ALTE